tara:strand:- start:2484 stop:2762 length:279 start_codon:yes stop_codon:yes gene_type:complete
MKKYWVEEWSQDTRRFEIVSNHVLDADILESTYFHGAGSYDEKADAEDITEEVIEEMKRMDYKTIPSDLKVTVKFTGTEYGDDSQTCSGEFA